MSDSLRALDVPLRDLHARLMAGDPNAREQICALLLPILLRRLPAAPLADARIDAAHDALVDYVLRPERFDPARGSLEQFIYVAAWRNLSDARRANGRRTIHESEYIEWARMSPAGDIGDRSGRLERLAEIVRALVSDPRRSKGELEAIRLIVSGERRTKALAVPLGGAGCALQEQQRLVKRFKDKVLKSAVRLAALRMSHIAVRRRNEK